MNGQKRRSARLSQEGEGENDYPAKKSKANGASSTSDVTTTMSTKQDDGNTNRSGRKKSRMYDEKVDGFTFTKGKRKTVGKEAAALKASAPSANEARPALSEDMRAPVSVVAATSTEDVVPKTAQKKTRRRLPSTPERETTEKPVRRSKRISQETTAQSPPKAANQARNGANTDRTPTPDWVQPITVEKKRKQIGDNVEEEKTKRFILSFADTPIIQRNKQMRKGSGDGRRRSSSGMRGRRASGLIDEGRGNGESNMALSRTSMSGLQGLCTSPANVDGSESNGTRQEAAIDEKANRAALSASAYMEMKPAPARDIKLTWILSIALPHPEVPTAEFYKHISAELTEPRRMRCLVGWCGSRALPPAPDPPKEDTPVAKLEFQALQTTRMILEELSQDLMSKETLNDWFGRNESEPLPKLPKKKPNPRNVANAMKVEELEQELKRLKDERAEWNAVVESATPPDSSLDASADAGGQLSPIHEQFLDSPQRAIVEQLRASDTATSTHPDAIQQRLQSMSENLEYTVDLFAHGIHTLNTARDVAERVADRTLAEAANVLEERGKQRSASSKAIDQMDVLRGLARTLNSRQQRP